MLKRISSLSAAATALMIVASPAAQAAERRGTGYTDRDGARQLQRHRGNRVERKGSRRQARRGDYRRHGYYPGQRKYRRRQHWRYAGPRIIWAPRYRHLYYGGWHRDHHYNLAVLFSVLETVRTGFTRRWYDPDTRTSGFVTPTRTYQLANGRYCREYQQRIVVDGNPVEGFGRACRQPDGSWRTVN